MKRIQYYHPEDEKPSYFGFFAIIIALILMAAMSSCSVTKKISKEKTQVDKMEDLHTSLSSTAALTSTVTKKADVEIEIKGDSSTTIVSEEKLNKGDTATSKQNGITTQVFKDKVGNTHVKTKTDGVKKKVIIDETTISSGTTTAKGEVNKTSETHSVVSKTDKDVKRTGGFNLNWLWLIIPVCLIICLFWLFGKPKKREESVKPPDEIS